MGVAGGWRLKIYANQSKRRPSEIAIDMASSRLLIVMR